MSGPSRRSTRRRVEVAGRAADVGRNEARRDGRGTGQLARGRVARRVRAGLAPRRRDPPPPFRAARQSNSWEHGGGTRRRYGRAGPGEIPRNPQSLAGARRAAYGVLTPSFAYVLERCASTVWTVTNRACAISLFVRPSAASAATCRSVRVSSPAARGWRPPTRASSARACPAQPGEPSASKSRRRAPRAPRARRATGGAGAARGRGGAARARRRSAARAARMHGGLASAARLVDQRPSQRGAALRQPPRMVLRSASARSRAVTARASSRAPSSTSASTRSRRDRERAGLVDALALRVRPTPRAGCSAARAGSCASSAAMPERPRGLERLPAVAARLGLRQRRLRPALGLLRHAAPGGEQRAAALVGRRDQELPVVGVGPLVEQPRGRVPLAGAQLELGQVQPQPRVGRPRRARRPGRGSGS